MTRTRLSIFAELKMIVIASKIGFMIIFVTATFPESGFLKSALVREPT